MPTPIVTATSGSPSEGTDQLGNAAASVGGFSGKTDAIGGFDGKTDTVGGLSDKTDTVGGFDGKTDTVGGFSDKTDNVGEFSGKTDAIEEVDGKTAVGGFSGKTDVMTSTTSPGGSSRGEDGEEGDGMGAEKVREEQQPPILGMRGRRGAASSTCK